MKVSFLYENAGICDRVGADAAATRNGIGANSRIGHPIIHPGIGYEGACFP